MDKETLDKVLAVLSKHGIDDEVINEVQGELNDDKTPTDTPTDDKDEKDSKPTPEPVDAEGEGETQDKEDEPKADEGNTDEGENKLPEGIDEVDLSKDDTIVDDGEAEVDQPLPPLPPQPEGDQPQVDNDTIAIPDEKDAKIDELQKSNEGLIRRIDALEDALRKGGILHDEPLNDNSPTYGIDNPTHISDNRDDDELFDNVLAEINKRH